MCRAVKCKVCGKTTWSGCGQHVDQVMRSVAAADRCPGHRRVATRRPSIFDRLLRRS